MKKSELRKIIREVISEQDKGRERLVPLNPSTNGQVPDLPVSYTPGSIKKPRQHSSGGPVSIVGCTDPDADNYCAGCSQPCIDPLIANNINHCCEYSGWLDDDDDNDGIPWGDTWFTGGNNNWCCPPSSSPLMGDAYAVMNIGPNSPCYNVLGQFVAYMVPCNLDYSDQGLWDDNSFGGGFGW